MPVKNRLAELIARKAREENRGRITYREIAEEAGVGLSTVDNWMNNTITRYDAEVIESFCNYLNCSLGDLLYREAEEVPESKPSLLAVS